MPGSAKKCKIRVFSIKKYAIYVPCYAFPKEINSIGMVHVSLEERFLCWFLAEGFNLV